MKIIWPGFILIVVVFITISPIFQTSINYVDEPEYFQIVDNNTSLIEFTSFYMEQGRYKPLGCIVQWCVAKVTNKNILSLRIWVWLLTSFSLLLLYRLLLKLSINRFVSLLITLLIFTAGFNEIWWRLGPYESLGFLILVTTANIYLSSTKRNWLFILLLFFGGLIKESFIPILLFIPLLKYEKNESLWSHFKKIKTDYVIVLMIVGIHCISLCITLHFSRGMYLSDSTFDRWFLLGHNIKMLFTPHLLYLAIIIILVSKKPLKKITFLNWTIIMIIWIICQLTVHSNTLIFDQSRYLMPGIILVYLCFSKVQQSVNSKVIILTLTLIVINNLKNNYSYIDAYRARTNLYHKALEHIKESKNLLIIMEPSQGREIVEATSYLLYSKYNVKTDVEECYIQNKSTVSDERMDRKYYKSLSTYKKFPVIPFEEKDFLKYNQLLLGHLDHNSLLVRDLLELNQFNATSISTDYFQFSIKQLIVEGEFKWRKKITRTIFNLDPSYSNL